MRAVAVRQPSFKAMNTALFDLLGKQNIDPARNRQGSAIGPERASVWHARRLRHLQSQVRRRCSRRITPPAVILHDRTLTLAQFESGRYDDPETCGTFAAKQVRGPPPSRRWAARRPASDIAMADGVTLSARWRASARRLRKSGGRAPRSSRNSAPMRKTFLPDAPYRGRHRERSKGWRISGQCAG